ncbi:MAG: FUSC family protein [Herbaspirillum sp.]
MSIPLLPHLYLPVRNLLHPLFDPAWRYRHANLIHAVRVALGLLTSIALTSGLHFPHGEWASITLLVVIGGLQHHGNIRRKAGDRALGTLIGAAVGLLVLLLQAWLQIPLLSYLLIVVACGICAYHAIGKGGYIALLSAITILIVAGHGENAISDGLWRSVNVLFGIAIALLFSFALPLYATYSWRYRLADLLRSCGKTYAAITGHATVSKAELQRMMLSQGSLLVGLRTLMPSFAKETNISALQLEEIQHSLRISVSLLEVLAAISPAFDDVEAQAFLQRRLGGEQQHLRDTLIDMAHALRSGAVADLQPRDGVSNARLDVQLPDPEPTRLTGYVSLTVQLLNEFDGLRGRLTAIADRWNV